MTMKGNYVIRSLLTQGVLVNPDQRGESDRIKSWELGVLLVKNTNKGWG